MATVTQTRKPRQRSRVKRFCSLTRYGDEVVLVLRQCFPRKGEIGRAHV